MTLIMFIQFIALILPLAAVLLVTPAVIKFSSAKGIVDRPQPRKIHKSPTPLLGGLAIYAAFLSAVIIFLFLGKIVDDKISLFTIFSILGAGLILVGGGYLDDRFNLKPSRQIIFPMAAIALVLLAGLRINFITNPLGGIIHIPLILGAPLAFFWLLGMVYTTKILDGLDGLVAGVTVIGALVIFSVSRSWDAPDSGTSYLALILAGSCLGFLAYNFYPAKIFLGEGGSTFCGFMLGLLAIISGSKIATALLIMGIPIIDVFWVIVQRLCQKNRIVAADRKHLHYRLLALGLSQRQAVIFIYFVTAGFGLSSLFLKPFGKLIALAFMGVFAVFLLFAIYLIYKNNKNNVSAKNQG